MTGSGTPDNGKTGIEFGEITGVCDASADYCLKLDTDEVVRATANRNTSFWESLRLDFTKLRDECAINPPLLPAGQLSAIWESQPEPGCWRLSYRSGNDSLGVAKRFGWHAQKAAARLGFKGEGDAAVAYWLDQVRAEAPESHLKSLVGEGALYSIEILDICGLSAENCRKCEGDEIRSGWPAQASTKFAETSDSIPPQQPALRHLVPGRSGQKKIVRRNQRYAAIDVALRAISQSRPRTQEEVFESLDARHVVFPTAEPFLAARGWVAGFRQDEAAARAWLSKRWSELNLAPLPRGPKKSKK